MSRGGSRQGAGRPKGLPNKDRREFLSLIHKIGKPSELIGKLKELAHGIKCTKTIPGAEGLKVVYDKPPDPYAITYMLDQAYGKAKQSMEIESAGEMSWEEMFGIGSGSKYRK